MPTALPLAFRKGAAPLEHSGDPSTATNQDLAVIGAFVGIGLALAIGLTVMFPQAANAVALAFIVS
jgi:hypothetical protein